MTRKRFLEIAAGVRVFVHGVPSAVTRRIVVAAVVASALFGSPAGFPNESIALVGGTIYVSPTEDPVRDGAVIVQDGTITAVGGRASLSIPPGVPTLDCSGLTITAGFWNSHVHFFERKWADAAAIPAPELERQIQEMLTRYGFTGAFDTGSRWENTRQLRDRIESGEVPGPRIFSTGEALVAPGAIPPDRILGVLGFMPFPAPEITDDSRAAEASRELLDRGVDGIKLHLQPPPPPQPPFPESAIAAAVERAHRAGKPVFVHPNSGSDVLAAVRAGVDVIAHTTPRSPWDETILSAVKERNVALTPTLALWQSVLRHDRFSTRERIVEAAVAQLREWVRSGGTVLFGTDLGAADYDPAEEYALMARAGLSFPEILASLTTAPAARFGQASRVGRVAAGLDGDLVVLKEDPSQNVRALAGVRYTLRAGKILYRDVE